MSEFYINVGTFSKIKFGISSYIVRVLSIYPFNVNWKKLTKLLLNLNLYYSFNSYDEYISYIFSRAIYEKKFDNVTTNVSTIFHDSDVLKPYVDYMLLPNELSLILEIF